MVHISLLRFTYTYENLDEMLQCKCDVGQGYPNLQGTKPQSRPRAAGCCYAGRHTGGHLVLLRNVERRTRVARLTEPILYPDDAGLCLKLINIAGGEPTWHFPLSFIKRENHKAWWLHSHNCNHDSTRRLVHIWSPYCYTC